MEMTSKALKDICKNNNLYKTPRLNDKLFANFHGFTRIQNLEAYTGLKALFLEGNALKTLEGLPRLEELKYVQQNCIRNISCLEGVPKLHTLDISNNELSHLQGLDGTELETLLCAHNCLESADSVAHLKICKALQTLDLQNNKLSDPAILDIIKEIPILKCLYLKGNPVVSKIRNYRKSVIAACRNLTYLDDRPIFPNEREITEAWQAGGVEAERAAREQIREREKAQERRNFEYMQAIRAEGFQQKRERLGLPEGDTDPDLDKFADSQWAIPVEPLELVQARKKLEEHMNGSQDNGTVSDETVQIIAEKDAEQYFASVRANERELRSQALTASSTSEHDTCRERLQDNTRASLPVRATVRQKQPAIPIQMPQNSLAIRT